MIQANRSSVQDLHAADHRPMYFIRQAPQQRAAALYAPALRTLNHGTQTSACILKQFCPRQLYPFAERNAHTGAFTLSRSARFFEDEWFDLKERFEREPALNHTINQLSGEAQAVFAISRSQSRSDLLEIHSADAISLADFAALRRPQTITPDYFSLCLTITKRLLHSVAAIHRVCLHLDITPQSIYIHPITQPPRTLRAKSDFTVQLLDLSAARKKEDFSADFPGASLFLSGAYTPGFSDTRLRDLQTLSSCFSPFEDYLQHFPIDESSDLFSVAAVLYFLLTGHAPPTGCETFYLALPAEGPLRSDALRCRLEDLLSTAIRLGGSFSHPQHAFSEFSAEIESVLQKSGR